MNDQPIDIGTDYDDDDDGDQRAEPISLARNPMVLAALGGLAVAALLVLLVKRAGRNVAVAPGYAAQAIAPGIVEGDWEASLEHLAAALDFRLGGLEIRLDEIVNERITRAAAVSVPVAPLIEPTGGPIEARLSGTPAGFSDLEPAAPPAPAAISVPPAHDDANLIAMHD